MNELPRRLIKLTSLFSFLLIIVAIIVLQGVPKATSYEDSIYTSLPSMFWFAIILSIFLGQLAILIAVYYRVKGRCWAYGVLAIAFTSMLLILLPAIHGYYVFGRDDLLTHIGWMKDILITGHIGTTDIYPLDHILGTSLYEVTGVSLIQLTYVIPLISYLFFVLSFYLLAKQICTQTGEVLMTMLFVPLLLFGFANISYGAYAQTFLILPFALYLLFRSYRSPHATIYRGLFILVLVQLTFFHPLIALVLIEVLVLVAVSRWVSNRSNVIAKVNEELSSPVNLITILCLLFLMWHSYYSLLVNSLSKTVSFLLGDSVLTQYKQFGSTLSFANPSLFSIVTLFLNTYGQSILIVGLAFLCIIYMFWRTRKADVRITNGFYWLLLALAIMFFTFMTAAIFFLPYVVGFNRLLMVVLFFSILLVPPVMYHAIDQVRRNRKRITMLMLSAFLVLLVCISTFNLFPSPYTRLSNPQVTESELAGMAEFLQLRNTSASIIELQSYPFRYNDAFFGSSSLKINLYFEHNIPQDHFGYPEYQAMGEAYNKSNYIMLGEVDRAAYPSLYPDYESKWRFTPGDFIRLKTVDQTANMVYNNGNIEIYLIAGNG